MTEPTAKIRVGLDDAAARKGFKDLEAAGKTSFTEINQGLELAKKGFDVIVGAIGAGVRIVAAWAASAAEAEKAQRGLATALQLAGDATAETLAKTQAFNSELLRKTGIDDDEIAALQTKLLALGVLPSKLEDATKATLGLADATGKDLTRASKEVARAFEGNAAEAERLTTLFAITEAQADTVSGRLKILEGTWSELGETMGGIVLESSAVKDALSALQGAVDFLAEAIERNRDAIARVFAYIVDTTARAASATTAAVEEIIRGFENLADYDRPIGFWEYFGIGVRAAIDATQFLNQLIDDTNKSFSQIAAKQAIESSIKTPSVGGFFGVDKESAQTIEFETLTGFAEALTEETRGLSPEDVRALISTISIPPEVGEGMRIAIETMLEDAYRRSVDTIAPALRELSTEKPTIDPGRNLLEKEGKEPKAPKPIGADRLDQSLAGIGVVPGEGAAADEQEATRARMEAEQQAFREHWAALDEISKQASEATKQSHELERAQNEDRFQAELNEYQKREQAKQKHAERLAQIEEQAGKQNRQFLAGLTTGAAAGLGQFVGTLIKGELSVGQAAKKLFGGMLSQLGQALIAMGSAAIAAGFLGTVAPIFGFLTGGPGGVAAGIGLVAAGAALTGFGGALSASARPPTAPSVRGLGGAADLTARESRGFESSNRGLQGEGGTTVINLNLAQGFLHGTPRELGRAIADYLEAFGSLRPQRHGGG